MGQGGKGIFGRAKNKLAGGARALRDKVTGRALTPAMEAWTAEVFKLNGWEPSAQGAASSRPSADGASDVVDHLKAAVSRGNRLATTDLNLLKGEIKTAGDRIKRIDAELQKHPVGSAAHTAILERLDTERAELDEKRAELARNDRSARRAVRARRKALENEVSGRAQALAAVYGDIDALRESDGSFPNMSGWAAKRLDATKSDSLGFKQQVDVVRAALARARTETFTVSVLNGVNGAHGSFALVDASDAAVVEAMLQHALLLFHKSTTRRPSRWRSPRSWRPTARSTARSPCARGPSRRPATPLSGRTPPGLLPG